MIRLPSAWLLLAIVLPLSLQAQPRSLQEALADPAVQQGLEQIIHLHYVLEVLLHFKQMKVGMELLGLK